MLKYFPIFACAVVFICWMMTYRLLTEQFNYVKSKDKISEEQELKLKEIEAKTDSTIAVLNRINVNLSKISKSTSWMR